MTEVQDSDIMHKTLSKALILLLSCSVSCNGYLANHNSTQQTTNMQATASSSTTLQSTQKAIPVGELLNKWLSDPNCSPPCWQGVIPGQTSAAEAMILLRRSGTFSYVADQTYRVKSDVNYFDWSLNVMMDDGSVSLWRGAIYTDNHPIIFRIQVPFPGVTLDELTNRLGTPEFVGASETAPIDIGAPNSWIIKVAWISRGFVANIHGNSPPPTRIDESLAFDNFQYFIPNMNGYLKLASTDDYPIRDLTNWEGYADSSTYFSNP